jgi:hypothetical protein
MSVPNYSLILTNTNNNLSCELRGPWVVIIDYAHRIIMPNTSEPNLSKTIHESFRCSEGISFRNFGIECEVINEDSA